MENVEIKYNSKRHQKLKDRLLARVDACSSAVSTRTVRWQKDEERFMAYMPESENDAVRRAIRDAGTPQYTSIQIPYSYAIALTAHTYLSSVFMGRSPTLQVQGRHGASAMQELGLESLLDYQVGVGGQLVPRYIWLLDALKYGLGVVYTYWDEDWRVMRRYENRQQTFMGEPLEGKFKKEMIEEELLAYQGCRMMNIRPQDWIFDPRYAAYRFQEGEFAGHWFYGSKLDMQDAAEDGDYFNLEHVRFNYNQVGSTGDRRGSSRIELPNEHISQSIYNQDETAGSTEFTELQVRLSPSEWDLGRGKRSEKWVFTLANRDVIVGCRPLGWAHDRYSYDILEAEVSSHALFNRSQLAISEPLNNTLDWLINTHFYNVRATLNNQLIADPSMVYMKDLEDPEPGKLVRLRPSAYGKDVRAMVSQIPWNADLTKTHVNDSQIVSEMLQRVTGVTDNIMGMMQNTGRKTAAEVRTSTSFGVNRMKTLAEYMSAQGWGPQAAMMIAMTQQEFDQDRAFRIVGDLALFGVERYIRVTPDLISGLFDFSPVDGALPIDRFAQVNMWANLLGQAKSFPEVFAQYDVGKIFAWVAQLGGIKNINQFKVQVVPDGQVLNDAQRGNVIPMRGSDQPNSAGVLPGPQLPMTGTAG